VENVKIKSKWKAQKRKELQQPTSVEQDDDATRDDSHSDAGKSDVEKDQAHDKSIPSLKGPTVHPSRADKIPGQALPSKHRQGDDDGDPPSEPAPSLRDLTRKAYSKSSLHTFKSDPLNRVRGSRTRGGRVDTRGGQRSQERRGQPNMKLRMDAMLEKIKRDFS
jgi:hypothetical protein